jgi:hemerythrin
VHHQEEHAKLLSQISALQVDLDSEVHFSAMTTYHYLTRWIKDHIVNVDMKLALTLRERIIEPQVN